MYSETGKGKIGIIIIAIVVIFLLAVGSFMLFKDSFINGPKVENEGKEADQLVNENALGEGVNKLDNGVYFKNFTAAVVNGTEKNGKSGKRFYEEYLNTGKGTGYYCKQINTYQEYLDFKAIQPDIIEMDEKYFNEYFMIVTAPYSTSFIGTGLDRIDAFEDTLYISFKYTGDSEDLEVIENPSTTTENKAKMEQLVQKYDTNECISFMIPNTMKKDKIQLFTNLINEQKDFSNEVKIAYNDDYEGYSKEKKERSKVGFKYLDKTSRELILSSSSGLKDHNYNYKNSIAENFTITKDMPEIDFSSWENLGNDYYALRLTDYSEYKKLYDNFGIRKLTNNDFKNIFVTIIVRKNTENSFSAEEVTVDANGVNLNIKTGGLLDVTEEFKYPAMLVYTPNYMNLTESNLKISVDK